jgi:hypothetical protein
MEMKNWEAELIEALREAEQDSTISDRSMGAKWRLVDQALHPHRRWLLWRYTAAVILVLTCIGWLVFRQLMPVNSLRNEHTQVIASDTDASQLPATAPVAGGEHNGKQIWPVLHPEKRQPAVAGFAPHRDSLSIPVEMVAVADTIVPLSPPLLAVSADTNEPVRGKRTKRSGTGIFIEGTDSGSVLLRPLPQPSFTARRKQAPRTGWVTQIRF